MPCFIDLDMEKRTINRYCFATSAHKPMLRGYEQLDGACVTVYRNHSHQVLVVETPPEMTFTELATAWASQGETSFEMLSKSLTEKIFQKISSPQNVETKDHSFSFQGAKTIAMTLELQEDPELLQAYKRVHHPENMWPQILINMDTMGVKNMELYLLGYRVFLLMDVPGDFDLEATGEKWNKLPQEQEWQEYVAKFQKTDPISKIEEKWERMRPST